MTVANNVQKQDTQLVTDPRNVDYVLQQNMCKILTLCLSFLITGNIMDNARGNEKSVIVMLDCAMTFSLLIWALASMLI